MIKTAFEKGTGRILGVQAVGMAGVNKQIDVLATAMLARMTVLDLEHLELSYAPPYGSAKGPVNMVGYVGSNLFRGTIRSYTPKTSTSKIYIPGKSWMSVHPRGLRLAISSDSRIQIIMDQNR